ncbi:MAG: DUF4405 domain-containing protein [bacterium]
MKLETTGKSVMSKRNVTNRRLNIINIVSTAAVFGTGLILLIEFHVGGGGCREQFMNMSKSFWLTIHKAAAVMFFAGAAIHIALHRKYIKTIAGRWGAGLGRKLKARSIRQTLLFAASAVVIGTGFYLWAAYPGAALNNEKFHHLLDVHNIIGLMMLISMSAHIIGRRQRIFRASAKAAPSAGAGAGILHRRGASILFHNPFVRHTQTMHVSVDVRKCKACCACAAVCGNDVLEIIDLRIHRHVHVSRAEKCRGCGKCVEACPCGAFEKRLKKANC